MRFGLALWAVVAVMVVAAAASKSRAARESRLPPEEQEALLKRLQKDYKVDPVCFKSAQTSEYKPMPPIPDSFTTELEMTHQEEGKLKVLYGAEAFDGVLNAGVLKYELREGIILTRPYDTEEIIHYNLITNESLVITTDTSCEDEGQGNCDPKKSCKAESNRAMVREMREIFGLGSADGMSGYYGVSGILMWTRTLTDYTYGGQTLCRGMLCDKYELCLKNDDDGTTALITYYWSLPDWTVDGNDGQVPLAIEVLSTDKLEPYFTRAVKQRYDFYEFYSNIRPDMDRLEPPADVYCKKRNSAKDPPKVPRFFAYNSEMVTPITISTPVGENQTANTEFTIAFTFEGYYDWTSKIVMLDYVPFYIPSQELRYEYETRQVQDFNQGLDYFMYKHLERCYIRPIENFTSIGDIVVNTNGTVSLRPPWMFEDLDGDWQYNGIHEARSVDADVWVGQRDLIGFLLHENYVMYYASPLVIDEPIRKEGHSKAGLNIGGQAARDEGQRKSTRYTSLDKVPMKLEVYLNIVASLPHLLNNIFDYQTQPPSTQSIDISLCYPSNARMRHFLLELPEDSLDQVKGLEDNLLHAVQMSLSEVAVISPLRINREMLDVQDDRTFVLFTILPLPSVVGDAPGAAAESDLDTAAYLITSAVDDSKLMIIVHLEGLIPSVEPAYVPLQAKSIKEVDRSKDNSYTFNTAKGYTSGDMAGLAFGVLALAALVGAGIGFVIQQRGDGQGGLPRVTMARKSPLSPSNTINIASDMTASDI